MRSHDAPTPERKAYSNGPVSVPVLYFLFNAVPTQPAYVLFLLVRCSISLFVDLPSYRCAFNFLCFITPTATLYAYLSNNFVNSSAFPACLQYRLRSAHHAITRNRIDRLLLSSLDLVYQNSVPLCESTVQCFSFLNPVYSTLR